MAKIESKEWKLCWRVNLLFHVSHLKPQKCFLCSNIQQPGTLRSTFWLEATRCSAGHGQRRFEELQEVPGPGLCTVCDLDFIFDVVKGKHECRIEGCRRTMRVDENAIRQTIIEAPKNAKSLLVCFLDFVQTSQVYECIIHSDEVSLPLGDTLAIKGPTKECNHDRNTCDTCLKSSFEAAIRDGRLQDLFCPDPECRKPIPKETIRPLVEQAVFKIYLKKLAIEASTRNPKFRWCNNGSCGHGQIHAPGESNPEWHCLKCNKRHCYMCSDSSDICEHLRAIDATKHRTRAEQRELAMRPFANRGERENEAANRRKIAQTTKKCPKAGCGNNIERNGGCARFQCTKCGTVFCWVCKVIWKSKESPILTPLHVTGCRLGTVKTVEKSSLNTSGYALGWDRDVGYDFAFDKGLFIENHHR